MSVVDTRVISIPIYICGYYPSCSSTYRRLDSSHGQDDFKDAESWANTSYSLIVSPKPKFKDREARRLFTIDCLEQVYIDDERLIWPYPLYAETEFASKLGRGIAANLYSNTTALYSYAKTRKLEQSYGYTSLSIPVDIVVEAMIENTIRRYSDYSELLDL